MSTARPQRWQSGAGASPDAGVPRPSSTTMCCSVAWRAAQRSNEYGDWREPRHHPAMRAAAHRWRGEEGARHPHRGSSHAGPRIAPRNAQALDEEPPTRPGSRRMTAPSRRTATASRHTEPPSPRSRTNQGRRTRDRPGQRRLRWSWGRARRCRISRAHAGRTVRTRPQARHPGRSTMAKFELAREQGSFSWSCGGRPICGAPAG